MFCHKCGAKLISGALFCSKCGTRVPEEIVQEMEGTASAFTEPDPVPTHPIAVKAGPEPAPEPIPEPETVPASEAKPESVSTPKPEAKPEPAPELKPEPEPEPKLEPKPEPEPKLEPKPEPELIPEPEPEPEAKPEPESLPEEKVYLLVTVTDEQLQREETIVLREDCLEEPMQLTLRKGMKDGMKLRLTNAKTKPAPNGAKRVAVVSLRVIQSTPKAKALVEKPVMAPSGSPSGQKAEAPQPPVRTIPTPRKEASFTPIRSNCQFQLCPENELKTGYKFGGTDKEGTIEIAPSALTVYGKSKGVALAFGVIGSAIEGKGKLLETIRPEAIASFKKANRNDYRIHLKDGRVLKVVFLSIQLEAVLSAVDQFLSQI